MRLAKYLAHAGVASRRASETIIADGRVTVDGAVITDPARDVDDSEVVKVDGRRVKTAGQTHVVYLLNKPAGVVSTAKDPQGRPTVVSLVRERRAPVPGRPARLRHDRADPADQRRRPRAPAHAPEVRGPAHLPRAGRPTRRSTSPRCASLREGVELEDGLTAPAKVRRLASNHLEITIHEGRKRQVKRMLEAVGHPVRSLERVAFGPLRLGALRASASTASSSRRRSSTSARLVECARACGWSRCEAPIR